MPGLLFFESFDVENSYGLAKTFKGELSYFCHLDVIADRVEDTLTDQYLTVQCFIR